MHRTKFLTSAGQLRVAQLVTEDGFLLHPQDEVQTVLTDGDRLRAVEYEIWSTEQIP